MPKELGADALCDLGCDLAQDTAPFRWYVIAEGSVGSENIMLECGTPASTHLRRHSTQGEHAMQQTVEDRTRSNRLAGDRVPPIIDQHVATGERLDLVPPQRRDIERVAWLELSHLRMLQGLPQSRKVLEVGLGQGR